MGFGGGTVLIIFLVNILNYSQTSAQGINLMFFVFCAFLALIKHIKNGLVDKKRALIISAGGIIGIAMGNMLLNIIPTVYLSKLFGVFVTLLGIIQLIKPKAKEEYNKDGTS